MKKFQVIRFQNLRLPQAFLVALALSLSFAASSLTAAPAAPNQSGEQLQSYLKSDIGSASTKDLEKAMRSAVKANPGGAPDYVEAYIRSGRKGGAAEVEGYGKGYAKSGRLDHCEELGRMVAAAISGLGPNPPVGLVTSIVERAVLLESRCAPAIVAAAVKEAPANFADEIVEVAIASVSNPDQMIGNVTVAEAILAAALGARPGLDGALLAAAADNGLARNLSRVLAAAMPSAQGSGAVGELNGIAAFQKNPNLAAFLAAERENNEEPPAEVSPQ